MWNSDDINQRGILLKEFIIQNDLTVLNKGKSPTFVSSRGQSIIDVTLVYGRSNNIWDHPFKTSAHFHDF